MKYFLHLLRFGESGDGGSGSATASTSSDGETSGVEIPSSIPERGRKLYAEVMKQNSTTVEEPKQTVTEEETPKESKPTYEDLIKSDDYKEAHRAYMEKTINDRIKKYKGIEERLKASESLLGTIGAKYGLDSEDKDYFEKLTQAIDNDDSYYEKYADEHDMTPAEARKIVTLERKLKESEARQEAQREEEARQQQFRIVQANSERTKALYPAFDLSAELQNPNFVRILSATQGDTTAAYTAVHHDEIVRGVAQNVAQQAKVATANAIASGQNRPIENGVNGSAPTSVSINFKNMTLDDIQKQAEIWRRQKR